MRSAETLAIADDLMAAFEKLRMRPGAITARPKVAPLRLLMAYGLAAQAHDIGQDAVRTIREGRFGAATPLVRVVFECGVHAQWLVIEPAAADAMAAESHRQRLALADNMAQTQRFLRHAAAARAAAGTAPTAPPSVSAKRFWKVCEQVDPAGNLYVMYRILSADTHAGEPTVARWFAEIDEPPGLAWRHEPVDPGPAQRDVLAGTLALSLLWATAGFDQMVKGRPLDRQVNAANSKIGHAGTRGVHRLVLPPRSR